MLKKLYEEGFLDYKSLLINKYNNLGITEVDLIILIKMLDLYKINKKVRTSKIASETGFSKSRVEESLDNLVTKGLYNLDFVENDRGMNDEVINFDPLFDKLELIFSSISDIEVEDSLKDVISSYESEVFRPITPQEYNTFLDWLKNDHFKDTEIIWAIKKASDSKRVNLNYIEKLIIGSKESSLRGKSNETKVSKLNKIKDMMR